MPQSGGGVWEWSVVMVSATVRGWCMGVVSCDGQCTSQGVVYGSGQL